MVIKLSNINCRAKRNEIYGEDVFIEGTVELMIYILLSFRCTCIILGVFNCRRQYSICGGDRWME